MTAWSQYVPVDLTAMHARPTARARWGEERSAPPPEVHGVEETPDPDAVGGPTLRVPARAHWRAAGERLERATEGCPAGTRA